jgi:acyl-CoA dehydrogenase
MSANLEDWLTDESISGTPPAGRRSRRLHKNREEKEHRPVVDFTLTDEQKDLRELAHSFAEKEMRKVAWEYDKDGTWPQDIIDKAWEVGLMNTHIPEAYGGPGLDYLSGCIIEEEVGWGCSGIGTSLMANGLASAPVTLGGSEETKKKYLGMLSEGPKLASFCLTEPDAGSDVSGMKTRAVKQGDKYVLNGSKCFITNGTYADWFTVYAKTDPEAGHRGISAFVVDANSPGVTVDKKEDKMGQRASNTATISFQDVEVPAGNLLAEENKGFKLAMMTLDRTRPGVASMAVGIARAAFEYATEYSKERVQFGVPIAMHQAIQFMIADMATKVEASRLLVWESAVMLDQGLRNSRVSSMAKRFAADSAMEVTTDAVQVYGGYGFIKEYPVEKLMRDAKIMQLYEGTSQIQRLVIAKEVLLPRQESAPAPAPTSQASEQSQSEQAAATV